MQRFFGPRQRALREVLAVIGLVLLAAAVRWPDFLYVPVFTDETLDVIRSLLIAQGRLQTPVNTSSYIGSIQNYLTAGLFLVFGGQIWLPRLLILVLGCLTIPAAYLLGRLWGGPWAGGLTALLLVANPVHVLVDSHIAWSNGMTPLFSTLAIWQLELAVRRLQSARLIWCATLCALAMLSHPAAAILLPGAAVYLVWRAPGLLQSRNLRLAALIFLAIYSPLLFYNLTADFDSLQFYEQVRVDHADGRAFGLPLYLANLPGFALLLVRTTSGAIDARSAIDDYLRDPSVLIWLVLAGVSLLRLTRRGTVLPLLITLSSLALAPLWSVNRFEPISNGRYLLPCVVALYAAIAASVTNSLARVRRDRLSRAAAIFGVLACLGLAIQLLADLNRFYDSRPADNRSILDAVERLNKERGTGEGIVLDVTLRDRRLGEGADRLDRTLEMLLQLKGVPYEIAEIEPEPLEALLSSRPRLLTVLDPQSVERVTRRYKLEPLVTITPRMNRASRQDDPVVAWRDTPLAAFLRIVDRQSAPDRRDIRACSECADPGVFRLTR